MKTKFTALMMSVLVLPLIAQASQVQISATAYSSDECRYYSTSLADFNVSFSGDLPYGSRVIFRYGFHDADSQSDWNESAQVEMTGSAPYTWTASVKGVQVDARDDNYFDTVQFDFETISPDGTVTYDNGGSSFGYYQATLPTRNCERGSMQLLPLSSIQK